MFFVIKNVYSGMVLAIKDGNKQHGAEVVVWPYQGGDNQLWTYNSGMILSKMHGFVLDIHPTNLDIVMSKRSAANSPKWYFNDDQTIRNKTGEVLDIDSGNTDPGTKVLAYEKHGGANQVFLIVPHDWNPDDSEDEESKKKKQKETSPSCACHLPRANPSTLAAQHMASYPYGYNWAVSPYVPMHFPGLNREHYKTLAQNAKNSSLNK